MERHPSAARRPGEPTKFLILPSAALLLGLSIVPLMMLILFSFVDGNVSSTQGITGFTLQNFLSMFQNATFSNLMVKSLNIALLVTIVCILIAYPAAWAIAQVVHPRHRNLLIMLAIVPAFTSQLLLIHSIMLLLQAGGPIMGLLGKLGLADPSTSILYTTPAVVIILIYEYLPYMILCLYSCLEKIDMNVVNASHTLGAGRVRTFFNVVLPQSFPGLLAGILIVFFFLLFFPILSIIVMSFNTSKFGTFPFEFTLSWYQKLFGESELLASTGYSLWFSFAVSTCAALLGVTASLALQHLPEKWNRRFSVVCNIPIIIPWLVQAVALLLLFNLLGIGRSFTSLGRSGICRHRQHLHRRSGHHWRSGGEAQYRHRLPELCLNPPHDGLQQHRLWPEDPQASQGGDCRQGEGVYLPGGTGWSGGPEDPPALRRTAAAGGPGPGTDH